jgi:deglycase
MRHVSVPGISAFPQAGEETFLPKVALQKAGYEMEVISTTAAAVEIYSFFERTGLLGVDKAIADARAGDYAAVLIPGGARSPALLAESPEVRDFLQQADARGIVLGAICRGSLLLAKSDVVKGGHVTGFNDANRYPELVVQSHAEVAGAVWVDAPVVLDGNIVTSPHPDHADAFSKAILARLAS